MKKLIKLTAMFLVAAALFAGCKNNADDNSGASFDDCTTIVTTVTLSDGNWTVKSVANGDGMAYEMTIKATVSNGSYTFKSGSGWQEMDLSKVMDADTLAEFNQLSDEQKKQRLEQMDMELPEGGEISFNGNKVKMTVSSLDAETLAGMQSSMDLADLPSTAVIETNSDNTKYVIRYPDEDVMVKIYISKD